MEFKNLIKFDPKVSFENYINMCMDYMSRILYSDKKNIETDEESFKPYSAQQKAKI